MNIVLFHSAALPFHPFRPIQHKKNEAESI